MTEYNKVFFLELRIVCWNLVFGNQDLMEVMLYPCRFYLRYGKIPLPLSEHYPIFRFFRRITVNCFTASIYIALKEISHGNWKCLLCHWIYEGFWHDLTLQVSRMEIQGAALFNSVVKCLATGRKCTLILLLQTNVLKGV
jgi:hypothetical protein